MKNDIIDAILNRIAEKHPIKKNVVIETNGKRFPVDAILNDNNLTTIFSVWYVGGEKPHILPLFNEHAALGVLFSKGVTAKIKCILVVNSDQELNDWEQWYKQFDNFPNFNNIVFVFTTYDFSSSKFLYVN